MKQTDCTTLKGVSLSASMRGGWWLALASVAMGIALLLNGAGEQVQLSSVRWMYYGPDTETYYLGRVSWVTPVYPLLLKGLVAMFGHGHLFALALVQILLWGLAVAAMWRMGMPLAGRWGMAATDFFALWPPLTVWTLAVYVEPVAICTMVYTALCLYMAMSHRGGSSRRWMWLFILCELGLILTRPAFAYVPIATLLTGVLAPGAAKCRRNGRQLIVAGLCGLLFAGTYTSIVYWRTGVMTPTCISVTNRYFMARRAGVIDPELNPDSAQRVHFRECLELDVHVTSLRRQPYRAWGEVTEMLGLAPAASRQGALSQSDSRDSGGRHPIECLDEMVSRSIAAHPGRYWRSVAESACLDLYAEPLVSAGNGWPSRRAAHPLQHWGGRVQMSLGLTLGAGVLWLVLLTVAIFIVPGRGNGLTDRIGARRFPLWLALCCLGNVGTIFLGAPYDHSRLFVESIPLLLLLSAIALHSCAHQLIKWRGVGGLGGFC
ncbi:MAG: glycosyltransferase family 39 protein [Candidatus Amulumruptor caecigallinarius]|nr:glycosyltransferase family 39 protein [Candidatus Amulumruptor caecigallinarius]MCM1396569.1 glycosyltransferase family 39 protein [Candidatus Amulumruptor caecigallinarius]MCM1453373.1 glycosyltransferase family 39 protein [bacterium]